MPKICEHCQQPYPDNLASCPNCDVFGAELIPPGGTPLDVQVQGPGSSSAVDLGSEHLPGLETFLPATPDPRTGEHVFAPATPTPQPAKRPQQPIVLNPATPTPQPPLPAGPLPPTKVQGPLPPKPTAPTPATPAKPVSAVKPPVAPPPAAPAKPVSAVKPPVATPPAAKTPAAPPAAKAPAAPAAKAPAAPAAPPKAPAPTPPQGTASPLMAKAAKAMQPKSAVQLPAAQPPAGQPTTVGNAPGAPTIVAPGAGQPTMIAAGSVPATQLAPPEEAGPLPIDPAHAPPAKATQLAPPGETGPLPIPGQSLKATMLARQSAAPTRLAPEGTAPIPMEGADPSSAKATMLAKQAQQTMLAGEGDLPGGAKQTMLARSASPQTTLAPTDKPGELPAGMKKTMLPAQGKGTMLQAEVYDLPDDELPDKKKTMLPPYAQQKTQVQQDVYELPGAKATMLSPKPEVTTLVPGDMMTEEMGGVVTPAPLKQPTAVEERVVTTAPAAKPRKWLAWVGGTALGVMLSAGGLFGFLSLPHDKTRDALDAVNLKWKDEPNDALQEAIAALERGDFKVAVDLIENWGSSNYTPRHAAVAGEARWMRYLSSQRDLTSLNRSDGQVAKATQELNEGLKDATTPEQKGAPCAKDAAFYLAHMEEVFDQADKARDLYVKGVNDSKADLHRFRFQAGIHRLEARAPGKANEEPAPKKDEPKEEKKDELKKEEPKEEKKDAEEKKEQARLNAEALELMAMLLTLQQGGADDPDEAGYKVWEALRALQNNDFKTAQEALRQAQVIYQKYRFQRLRKAQNPKSDPTDELFGRLLGDALIVAEIKEHLNKYPEYKGRPIGEAVDLALRSGQKPDAALAKIAEMLKVPNNIGEIMKGMEALMIDRDIANTVKDAMVKGKYIKPDEKDGAELKKVAKVLANDALVKLRMHKSIEDVGFKDPDAEVSLGQLLKDRQDFIDKFNLIVKMLQENDYLRAKIDVLLKEDRPEVVAGVDRVIDAAKSPLASALGRTARNIMGTAGRATTAAGPTFDLAAQLAAAQANVAALKFRLTQVRSARDMMGFWPAVLEEARNRKEIIDAAAADARHVLDPNYAADELTKAQAHTVQALAQRNSEQFDDARTSLQQALKNRDKGPWRAYAENANKELTDPSYYYIPRANDLAGSGKFEQAVALLKSAVAAFPKEGALLALRGVAQLELAKDKVEGRLTSKEPLIQAARQDGQAAIDTGSVAEGNYTLGRVAEDLDDRLAAEKHYRQALAAHPGQDNASSRYRVALGRVLLKLNPIRPVPLPPAPRRPAERAPEEKAPQEKAPEPNKVGQLRKQSVQQVAEHEQEEPAAQANALQVLIALIAPLPVVVEDEHPELDEIIRLAEEAIKNKNYEGYLIKARALARKGQWTRALREYSEGLKYLIPPGYAAGLSELVDNHPAINLPDSLRVPDPTRAERHFGNGLRFYFGGQYANAEAEFIEAYRNNGQDARYLYYLGLSRLPQRDKAQAAAVNFEMGSLLERQNKPSPAAINASLERVQGPVRQRLQGYRP